jgi:hypothetical protein
MYRLLQSTMNSVAYVREYGRSEDIPHLRRDFVGGRRRWSRWNCQGLSSSWNEEIRNANSAPRKENRAVKWRRMKRGFRWKTRMAMKKGCSRRRENRGQWMRWRKRRDQVYKGVIIFKVQTWHGGCVAHKTLGWNVQRGGCRHHTPG